MPVDKKRNSSLGVVSLFSQNFLNQLKIKLLLTKCCGMWPDAEPVITKIITDY